MKTFNKEINLQRSIQENHLLACTVINLEKINENSAREKLNRNLYLERFKSVFIAGMRQRGYKQDLEHMMVMLIPFIVHHHKAGRECDSHVRCQIVTDGICGPLFIDIKEDDWSDLVMWNIQHGYAEQLSALVAS